MLELSAPVHRAAASARAASQYAPIAYHFVCVVIVHELPIDCPAKEREGSGSLTEHETHGRQACD